MRETVLGRNCLVVKKKNIYRNDYISNNLRVPTSPISCFAVHEQRYETYQCEPCFSQRGRKTHVCVCLETCLSTLSVLETVTL